MKNNILKITLIALSALLLGCNDAEIKFLKEENATLKVQIKALAEENKKLKETAEYHFKSGQDHMMSGDWKSAAAEFQIVIDKYPNDPLTENSKSMLLQANSAIADEVARHEKELSERGEPIEYGEFYAKTKTGMPIGKRYRFTACINQIPCINSQDPSIRSKQSVCSVSPEFDDPDEYASFLSEGRQYCGEIVAGMQWGGTVAVYRLH